MDYNKVILLGRLTRDPEVKYLSSGTAFCSFGIATNRHYNAQNGERQQEVCFVDCKAFGRQAEIIGDYVVKGSPLLIDGRLSFYQYEDENGQNRSKLSVIAERVQLMGRRGNGDSPPEEIPEVETSAESKEPDKQPPSQEEDIPF